MVGSWDDETWAAQVRHLDEVSARVEALRLRMRCGRGQVSKAELMDALAGDQGIDAALQRMFGPAWWPTEAVAR